MAKYNLPVSTNEFSEVPIILLQVLKMLDENTDLTVSLGRDMVYSALTLLGLVNLKSSTTYQHQLVLTDYNGSGYYNLPQYPDGLDLEQMTTEELNKLPEVFGSKKYQPIIKLNLAKIGNNDKESKSYIFNDTIQEKITMAQLKNIGLNPKLGYALSYLMGELIDNLC